MGAKNTHQITQIVSFVAYSLPAALPTSELFPAGSSHREQCTPDPAPVLYASSLPLHPDSRQVYYLL